MKKMIAGNWKMNGTVASARSLIVAIGDEIIKAPHVMDHCDFLVCPSFVHLNSVRRKLEAHQAPIALGAQDCSSSEDGAFTGDISATMLADMKCEYVILGHSERRTIYGEASALVSEKVSRAHMHNIKTIICVGESESEREDGKEYEVVGRQLEESLPAGVNATNTIIAYEPVWAIGTGKSATPEDVKAMHSFIREKLQETLADFSDIRILYGGSVKPENAASLFEIDNVNGALIGGASLKAEQFIGIAKAA